MATVSVLYNNPHNDKTKQYPVVFVIRHRSRHAHINSGIKLFLASWDKRNNKIKATSKEVLDPVFTNAEIGRTLSDIQTFLSTLTQSGEIESLSVTQLKKRYLAGKKKEKYNFSTYYKDIIKHKAASTQRIYNVTFDMLQKFYGATELSFNFLNSMYLSNLSITLSIFFLIFFYVFFEFS